MPHGGVQGCPGAENSVQLLPRDECDVLGAHLSVDDLTLSQMILPAYGCRGVWTRAAISGLQNITARTSPSGIMQKTLLVVVGGVPYSLLPHFPQLPDSWVQRG